MPKKESCPIIIPYMRPRRTSLGGQCGAKDSVLVSAPSLAAWEAQRRHGMACGEGPWSCEGVGVGASGGGYQRVPVCWV